jgi:hypothetical protein
MFMGPCIVGYENHTSNQQDATFMLFIDSNTLHVSAASHPSSGTVCAAYGTGMLIYVMIGSTVLWSMWLWVMSYNIM